MLLSGPVRSQFIPLHWRGEPFDPTPNHVSPTRPCLTKGATLEALGPFAGGPIGLGHPPSGTLMSMQASVWGKTRMWSSGDRLVLGYIKRPALRGVPGRSSSSQREAFTGAEPWGCPGRSRDLARGPRARAAWAARHEGAAHAAGRPVAPPGLRPVAGPPRPPGCAHHLLAGWPARPR